MNTPKHTPEELDTAVDDVIRWLLVSHCADEPVSKKTRDHCIIRLAEATGYKQHAEIARSVRSVKVAVKQ